MKKTVWTFGLIAGALMSVMMVATLPLIDRIGFGTGEVIGYTTMVVAFLLVFFGIRSYRDNVCGETIGFGRAFVVGALITCIAGVCYTATWEVLYFKAIPDFGTRFAQAAVDKARAEGKSEAEIAKTRAEMEKFAESYKNPVYNSAVTFLEPLPVGLVITLVSAGVLRRRRRSGEIVFATA
jgi:hypothetical protein